MVDTNYRDQLQSGTFEHSLHYLVTEKPFLKINSALVELLFMDFSTTSSCFFTRMKQYNHKEQFVSNIHELLKVSSNIQTTTFELGKIYTEATNEIKLAKPFKIELIDSESIQYSVYYQEPINMSSQTISITHKGYNVYLWMDSEGWCLDDSFYGYNEISISLANAPLFDKIPENVKELRPLMLDEYWEFKINEMPFYTGIKPTDSEEVLSWDDRYLLVGTNIENITLVSREDWDRLCNNECHWFKA